MASILAYMSSGERRVPAARISATRSPTSFLTLASGSVAIARPPDLTEGRSKSLTARYNRVAVSRGAKSMILQRVRNHVSQHNWFAAAIDLLIVMIGVFLGTQASEWSQNQAERREAREFRAMLIGDLRANQQNLAM